MKMIIYALAIASVSVRCSQNPADTSSESSAAGVGTLERVYQEKCNAVQKKLTAATARDGYFDDCKFRPDAGKQGVAFFEGLLASEGQGNDIFKGLADLRKFELSKALGPAFVGLSWDPWYTEAGLHVFEGYRYFNVSISEPLTADDPVGEINRSIALAKVLLKNRLGTMAEDGFRPAVLVDGFAQIDRETFDSILDAIPALKAWTSKNFEQIRKISFRKTGIGQCRRTWTDGRTRELVIDMDDIWENKAVGGIEQTLNGRLNLAALPDCKS